MNITSVAISKSFFLHKMFPNVIAELVFYISYTNWFIIPSFKIYTNWKKSNNVVIPDRHLYKLRIVMKSTSIKKKLRFNKFFL